MKKLNKPIHSGHSGKFFTTALMVVLMSLFFSFEGHATHYRYGNISWSRVNSSSRTVTITVTQAWRATFYGGVAVGAVIPVGQTLLFGDSTSAPINITVTSYNVGEDWFYGTYTVVHTYAGALTSFTLSYAGNARISSLQNNADGGFSSKSIVNLTGTNLGSPVASTPPIINLPVNQAAAAFNIPAVDPDGGALTYALAPNTLTSANNPVGLAIGAGGAATFNTIGKVAGQLWQGAFVITDVSGSTTVVDFMMFMVAPNTPPIFDYLITPANGAVFNINPGQNIAFNVKALDVDVGSTVTLTAVGLPTTNYTFSPGLPTTANPVTSHFSFTPSFSQLGIYIITFTATRNGGIQTSTNLTINVNTNPQFIAPTKLQGASYVILSNTLNVDTVTANNPDPSVNTSIFSGSIPAGASMSPALPTAFVATPSTQMSWTPTPADYGPHTISFVAKDANGRTATRSYILDVNTVPVLDPKSDDNIMACSPYSFTITAIDPDMPYGDIVDIIAETALPAWLTLTPGANGTATLSGTPSAADVGTYSIGIAAEDLHHHSTGVATLEFEITVAPDTTPPVLTAGLPQDVTLDANCMVTIPDLTGSATDNCGSVTITQAPAIGTLVGSSDNTKITIVITATDGAGLTDQKNVQITAKDLTPPSLTPAANQEVYLNASCLVLIPDVSGTATDNCSGTNTTQSPSAGSTQSAVHNATINVVVTATDAAGLTDVETVVLTVKDNTPPALTPGADQNVTLNTSCSITIPDVRGTATDNCGISGVTQSPAAGSTVASSHNGTVNVTVTATDAVGLTDVKMVVLTAKDTSPPTITCRPNIVLNACQPTATWTTPTASDNCSGVVVTQTGGSLSGSTFTNGTTTTISYKATDGGGNQATCSFTVTRANAMNLTVTNSNPQLYFGYSLDQSTVIKGVPTGGVPPYTMTITMNRPLSCNMVNSTGDEKWLTASGVSTGSICPSSGPGTVPLTSATLLAGGSNSVTATLLGNAVIIVTVTDANGCSISKSTNVYAEDARCFAGNSGNEKVKLCHRTGNTNEPCHELCVSENAVSAHLAHGDYIGGCLPNCATPPVYRGVQSLDFDVRAYPNPSLNDFTIVVDSKISSKIILNIYDMSSRLVKKIEGNYGKPIVFGDDLPTGIYYTVVSQDDNQKTLKLIKQ